jgi:hypothetical protein
MILLLAKSLRITNNYAWKYQLKYHQLTPKLWQESKANRMWILYVFVN